MSVGIASPQTGQRASRDNSIKAAHKDEWVSGYSGYFSDPDGYPREIVTFTRDTCLPNSLSLEFPRNYEYGEHQAGTYRHPQQTGPSAAAYLLSIPGGEFSA